MKCFRGLILLIIVILSGCSASAQQNIKWFDSETDAIEYGIKQEGIEKEDIVEKITIKEDKFVVYKFNSPDGEGVAIANINNKDNQFAWDRTTPNLIVKSEGGTLKSHTDVKGASGEKYIFYTGAFDNEEEKTIDTDKEKNISPKVINDSNLYYFLEIFK
ncbi:hypothetical protein ACQCT6_18170 [Cytobacillus gottheilii]|uniref:hypothetical protein n=1 Tax=Cytobacillus gottheilii TaxID=859144 RepID=UPI003CF1E0B2